jgi:hypothetical protein
LIIGFEIVANFLLEHILSGLGQRVVKIASRFSAKRFSEFFLTGDLAYDYPNRQVEPFIG